MSGETKKQHVSGPPGMPGIPDLEAPISPKENFKRLLDTRDPLYTPNALTDITVTFPDHFFGFPADGLNSSGVDKFGVSWTYEPSIRAITPTPNCYAVTDIEEWRSQCPWPDVDAVDYDSVKRIIRGYPQDRFNAIHLEHGFFERFHHIVGFETALMSFYLNPTEVHEIMDALLELKLKYFDRMVEAGEGFFDFIIDSDDMGTQRDTFFSPDVFLEFIYPRKKILYDHIHSKGLYVDWHSCGNNAKFLDYYIDLKIDLWEAQASANDIDAVAEKYGDHFAIQHAPASEAIYDDSLTDEELLSLIRGEVDKTVSKKCHVVSVAPRTERAAQIVIPEMRNYSIRRYAGET